MKLNFHFGSKRPDKKQLIIVGIVTSTIIALLSKCTGFTEEGLWDLLDEVQRNIFKNSILNEIVIKDPNKVERRVIRDVDRAIYEIIPEYERIIKEADKKYQPIYIEEVNDESLCYSSNCKLLAPPMRICSPWLETCKTNSKSGTEDLTKKADYNIINKSLREVTPEPKKTILMPLW